MDFFDERILTMLKDGKPRGFTTLLKEVGFSHNTLQVHLERLTTKGLVAKEKSGRKRF
jgi:predicted ArsR family transcriptional regulator